MNSDTLRGQWKQLRGTIKAAFGQLTDDDLLQADDPGGALKASLQMGVAWAR